MTKNEITRIALNLRNKYYTSDPEKLCQMCLLYNKNTESCRLKFPIVA